jgi:spore maturation protein CgeB
MKILVIASTIDLKQKLGCTPAWWQLLKALNEIGNDIIVIPYLGNAIDTLWWRSYENPCNMESLIYNFYLEGKKRNGVAPGKKDILSPLSDELIEHYIKPKWEKRIRQVLDREKDIDFIFFMNVPLNHITGIASKIKQEYHIGIAYYDGDMPTILPKYSVERGFKFNYYDGADLTEYDIFFTNSKGVIPDLHDMGARNITPLYYAADPTIFKPVDVKEQDIDVSFYGHGNELRQEWMTKMITIPSKKMGSTKFNIAGSGFNIDLGNATIIPDLPMNSLGAYCCRSKICLNITRWSHTNIYASATARIFELAAFGACIVSQPYKGLEEWFDVGRDLLVVNNANEAIDTYTRLISSSDDRCKLSDNIRQKVLKDHTYQNRAYTVVNSAKKVAS